MLKHLISCKQIIFRLKVPATACFNLHVKFTIQELGGAFVNTANCELEHKDNYKIHYV